jgi:hypothetical protein
MVCSAACRRTAKVVNDRSGSGVGVRQIGKRPITASSDRTAGNRRIAAGHRPKVHGLLRPRLRPLVSNPVWQVYRAKQTFSRPTSVAGFIASYQLEELVDGTSDKSAGPEFSGGGLVRFKVQFSFDMGRNAQRYKT